MQPKRCIFPLLAPFAAVLLALALPAIEPVAARASGVETGPQGIAVNGSGDVYVSDWARQTVDEITPQGVSILAGTPGRAGVPTPGPATDSMLGSPKGLAVSRDGDLYIDDFANCAVEKVTPTGTLSIVAGKAGHCGTPTPGPATSSMLASPLDVAVDSDENVYIADQGTRNGSNNVIERVTPSGTLSIFAGELAESGEPTPGPASDSKLNFPQAVAVDGAGNVYIADTENRVVEKVNTQGILSIYASAEDPQGVAASASGDVYVIGGNRVQEVNTSGQLTTIAGDGQAGEPTPGREIVSMLDQPIDAAVDSSGNVYIADTGNDIAEKVTPASELDPGELSIIWATEDPIPGSTLTAVLAGTGSGSVASSPPGIACPKTCFTGYEPDTPVTLTATPNPGSTFAGWSGAGCSGTGTCQVTMSTDIALTAIFQQLPPVTLTVALAGSGSGSVSSSPSGIACPGTCSHAYESDLPVTLTANPKPGSTFVGWEGSGCSGTGSCQVTMTSEMAVTAMFEKLPVLSVSIAGSGSGSVSSSPSGIACPGTCSNAYPPGTQVTLTPIAPAGSRFVGWEGSGCSGTGTCQVTMSSEMAVTAMFEKLPVLSVSIAGSGSGSVSSSPSGIACPGTCSNAYPPGTQVTLTATAAPGSRFTGWEGAGCSGTGACRSTVGSETTVTATFERLPVLGVSIAGSGAGSVESSPSGIACPGTCSHVYEPGTTVSLTATPAAGSRFAGWEGSECSGTGTCRVTMSSDAAVTAMFEQLSVLSVSIAGSGAGSVESSPSGIACPGTCSNAYQPGTQVTLMPVAPAGSRFVGWEGSGCSGTGTCQVAIASDTAVSAVFERLLSATPFEQQLPEQPFSPPASFKPPAPVLSHVKLAPKLLTVRRGASLQFVVSQSATIEVEVAQHVKGHRPGRVCKASVKKGRHCAATVEKRTSTFSATAGPNTFELRLAGFGRGSCTAMIVAENINGTSTPTKLAFTIAR
ncbi:MAG TPA: hypothetical protein VK790_10140 [Solirubrobacteraceae bacterium]|nr:hypothetical protein [Solirubrobacteraceae bacterium]